VESGHKLWQTLVMRNFLLVTLTSLGGCATGAASFGPSRLEAETALVVANSCRDFDGLTTCTVDQVEKVRLDQLRCKPLPPNREAPARALCAVAGTFLMTNGRSRDLRFGRWEFRLVPRDDNPRRWIAIAPLD
jgi:hypothetical protein